MYLKNFAGQPAAAAHAMAAHSGGESQAWSKLTDALNLVGANIGDRRETPSGAPRLAGVVERVHQEAQSRQLMLRLDEPAQGIALIGSFSMGDEARGMASIYFYGPGAAEAAAAENPKWTTWLRGVLQGEPAAT